MREILLKLIKLYQYISALFPASCRYYPTCSEYAKWQFELNRADRALLFSILRILRCNQLFRGGIDYPIITYNRPNYLELANPKRIKIKYWIIPKEGNRFYVVKS